MESVAKIVGKVLGGVLDIRSFWQFHVSFFSLFNGLFKKIYQALEGVFHQNI